MTKLNQMLALRSDADRVAQHAAGTVSLRFQNQDNMRGLERSYVRKDEDGDIYPSESKPVQYSVRDVLNELRGAAVRQLDILATIDWANTTAKADLVVAGKTLIEKVPATFLLTLESRLSDWEKMIEAIPVLDPSKDWNPDPVTGHWIADPVETIRTRKVPKAHVLYEATERHPAQVQPYTVDEKEGTWRLVERSGAIDAPTKREILQRVRTLKDAVIVARQEANSTQIEDRKIGDTIFGYVFG